MTKHIAMPIMTERALWEIIGRSNREAICAFDLDYRLIAFNTAQGAV